MIRLAVCDDEAQCAEDTSRMIRRWMEQNDRSVQILSFDNGDALIENIRTARADIILLDIIMPLFSGMDAAREIRRIDPAVKIVFLTSSPEFALESYSVKASGYLLKPVQYASLSEILNECAAALTDEPKSLLIKTACGYQKIDLRDIEYLEAQNKRITFFLHSGKSFSTAEPLFRFENKLLFQDGFFKCHRSYIVSMSHVDSFHSGEIIMKSGSRIPVARGAAKAFQDAYFAFMFRE